MELPRGRAELVWRGKGGCLGWCPAHPLERRCHVYRRGLRARAGGASCPCGSVVDGYPRLRRSKRGQVQGMGGHARVAAGLDSRTRVGGAGAAGARCHAMKRGGAASQIWSCRRSSLPHQEERGSSLLHRGEERESCRRHWSSLPHRGDTSEGWTGVLLCVCARRNDCNGGLGAGG